MSTPVQSESVPFPREGSLKLTGGIEIECLLLTDTRAKTMNHLGAQMKVYAALSAPMRVICSDCRKAHLYRLPLHMPNEMASNDDSYDDRHKYYSKWNISLDGTLGLRPAEYTKFEDNSSYHLAPIEIQSRVLNLAETFETEKSTSDPGHIHKITYRDEIAAVYSRLNQSFNDPDGEAASESRIVTNETCSTHVHIGNGRNGFPLRTVKNIASLVVAHEMHFDAIHATDRITGSNALAHVDTSSPPARSIPGSYNHPWSTSLITDAATLGQTGVKGWGVFRYPAKRFVENPGLQLAAQNFDVPSWLSLIESAGNVGDLIQLTKDPSTVRLKNLQQPESYTAYHPEPDGSKLTIEFRQHAATLQQNEILNWIEILVSLFTYANTTAAAEVKTTCLQSWDDPNFTMLSLLTRFGHRAEDDVVQHYSKVLGSITARKTYAELIESEELKVIGRFSPEDLFVPLMRHLVTARAKTIHPDKVRDLIRHKFASGGYGQFSESYLGDDKFGQWTSAQRKYLTLGSVPELSD